MTDWLRDLAGFRNSPRCFKIFANILRLQCYLILFGFQSAFESSTEKQQLLSSVLSKVYQNPYYFYNLNPSLLNPAFNRIPTANSPTVFGTLHSQRPIFSVQLRPDHRIQPKPLLAPSQFFYADPLPASSPFDLLYNQHENKLPNELSKPTNQYEPNRKNPLFHNRVGSLGENRLPGDLLDQRLDASHGELVFAFFLAF